MQKNRYSCVCAVFDRASPRVWGVLVIWCLAGALSSRLYAASLDTLRSDFIRGDYKACIRDGEAILATARTSTGLDELYYILGLSYLKDGNYLRASDIFEIVLHEYKDSRFMDEARLGLGDSHFLRSDFVGARSLYDSLLKDRPRTKLKAGVYYRLSLLGKRTGNRALEQEYKDRLIEEFPLSPEALSKGELFPASVAFVPRPTDAPRPFDLSFEAEPKPVPAADAPKPVPAGQTTAVAGVSEGKPEAETAPADSSAQPEKDEVQSLTLAAGAYSIQVGAFSSRVNAQNLARKLNGRGYSAFIVQETSHDRPLFKVRVGHFADPAEAKKTERQLRLQNYPTKIIP